MLFRSQTGSGLNSVHCLNIEYATRERTMLCVSAQYFHTGIYDSKQFYSYDSYYGNSVTIKYDPVPYKPVQQYVYNASIGFKFFRHGAIAPLGKYTKLEFLLLFSQIAFPDNSFSKDDGYVVTHFSPIADTYNATSFSVALTMGRSRVLFNRLVLDYGFRLGVCPSFVLNQLFNDFTNGISTSNHSPDYEATYKRDAHWRLLTQQVANFHIGIGFLT